MTIFCLLFWGCKSSKIPEIERLDQDMVFISYVADDGSFSVNISNTIKAPIRVKIKTTDSSVGKKIEHFQQLVLQAEQDTLLQIGLQKEELPKLDYEAGLGDPHKKVTLTDVGLPIPGNKAVRIIQGHHGTYSHDKNYSRYAIDFALKVGDTVFAAYEGFAFLVNEGYSKGGKDIRYLDYANKIMVYNPDTGLFFQYSHLDYNGALIEQGDWVNQGEPIGISGMTGYTDIPHLHFNVMVPDSDIVGMKSVPVDFVEGYRGSDLQRNVVIRK